MRRVATALLLISLTTKLTADKIQKTDGVEIDATVLRVTDQAMEYKTATIPFLTIARSEVKKIIYASGEVAELAIPESAIAGFHRHDGMFLRLAGGYSYGVVAVSVNSPFANTDFGGLGAHVNVGVGYSVLENWAVYFHAGSGGGSIGKSDLFPVHVDFGVGASWYWMPWNGYISVAILGTQYRLSVQDTVAGVTTQRSYASGTGAGAFVSLGKEWWVSANWGLGAALYFYHGRMPDGASTGQVLNSGPISTTEVGILFSATYN